MVKTGRDHLRSLQDGRAVYIDAERVKDVTEHAAFRRSVRSACGLYDQQAANLETMTFVSPTSGGRVNRLWQLPRNQRELVERRQALQALAEVTCGMIGRSPDHVGSSLAGMVMGRKAFEKHGPKRAQALADYFAYARDRDLYLSYVIINPQADRSKAASNQPGEDLVARIVDEDAQGITIRGAKMLGTGVIFANEIMVSGFMGLQAGEEDFAFTAMVPMNAKGLKAFSRKSYEQAAVSVFDNPLSSRFDENDAVVWFEDVKIPWDRVLVCRDVQMAQGQWHDTRAHVLQNYQCQIRLMVKLRFLIGLARKIAEVNGIINYPQVRETLGLLAAKAVNIEAMVIAMEAAGERFGEYYVPNRAILSASQAIAQELYPEVLAALRTSPRTLARMRHFLSYRAGLIIGPHFWPRRHRGESGVSAAGPSRLFKRADLIGEPSRSGGESPHGAPSSAAKEPRWSASSTCRFTATTPLGNTAWTPQAP